MSTDEATPAKPKVFSRKKQAAFLAAYQTQGSVRAAAAASGVGRNSHWRWLIDDPTYPARFQAVEEDAIDSLEEEARRRAISSSDVLLIFLLKGARPEKYRERTETRQTGETVVRVEVTHQEDWYGRSPVGIAETPDAPDPGPAEPGPV